MLTLFSKQLTKAIDECKSSAVMAKKFVGNIETRKWSIKKKNKMRAFQVTADDDDEYVSWGSDFDESCSDDGADGRNSRTNDNCDNNDDDVDEEEDEEDEDDVDGRLSGRCGSYSLSETERSSCQLRSIKCASTFDNTYEAISETPSTSSYCGSSENSSTFYETPPERRRGSCPSEKSSSGIGEMNGSTRSNSGDDRSELSEHCSVYDYSTNEKKRISQHPHQLSIEVSSEYIMRELNRKKRSFLNGCEASSEASSGQCSEPSPKARIRPLVKPAIPPKPNLTQFNPSKPGSPGTRRKVRRKIVRPTGEPPPPPVPKSPPPISPASSKLSLTDRLAELTLDDLNEVLGVQLSSDPEDNDFASENGDCVTSGSTVTLTASNIEKVTAAAAKAEAAAATATESSPSIVKSNCNNETTTLNNVLNGKDHHKQSIGNHNLTKSDHLNQEKMGQINDKISKLYHHNHKNNSKQKKINKDDNYNSDKIFSSTATDVTCIVNDVDDEDFGDYETPLNFKYPMSQNLNNNADSRTNTTASNSAHSGSSSTCTRLVSRSSSVASGSYVPDSGFSDCTGISPYPISPPPPFDDNYCCSCRRLMKSVGSTPNLHAIRPSSRSDLSLSTVTSTTPLSSSLSSSSSMKNQSNTVGTSSNPLTTTAPTFDNDSHHSSSSHHHHHHHYHHNHHHHNNNNHHHHQHSHSHSTSNLSLLTVDRPKLPRSKPDCSNSNSNNNNNNNSNNSLTNGNHSSNSNNNNSSGISFKAEFAAKFAEKAAFAKKIINSRPPFKTFESIYATGKSFGFSSSSSSANNSSSSVNHNNNINRSGSTCNLAQRPLPPLPDDVMPIEKYSWFHGLERDSATAVLKDLGTEGAYLIRPSKRAGQSNPLTLSILHEGKVFHLNVRRRSDGLYCLGKEKDKERTFESVPALIRFHQKEPILLTTKGESAGITKLMVTPISSSSISSST